MSLTKITHIMFELIAIDKTGDLTETVRTPDYDEAMKEVEMYLEQGYKVSIEYI